MVRLFSTAPSRRRRDLLPFILLLESENLCVPILKSLFRMFPCNCCNRLHTTLLRLLVICLLISWRLVHLCSASPDSLLRTSRSQRMNIRGSRYDGAHSLLAAHPLAALSLSGNSLFFSKSPSLQPQTSTNLDVVIANKRKDGQLVVTTKNARLLLGDQLSRPRRHTAVKAATIVAPSRAGAHTREIVVGHSNGKEPVNAIIPNRPDNNYPMKHSRSRGKRQRSNFFSHCVAGFLSSKYKSLNSSPLLVTTETSMFQWRGPLCAISHPPHSNEIDKNTEHNGGDVQTYSHVHDNRLRLSGRLIENVMSARSSSCCNNHNSRNNACRACRSSNGTQRTVFDNSDSTDRSIIIVCNTVRTVDNALTNNMTRNEAERKHLETLSSEGSRYFLPKTLDDAGNFLRNLRNPRRDSSALSVKQSTCSFFEDSPAAELFCSSVTDSPHHTHSQAPSKKSDFLPSNARGCSGRGTNGNPTNSGSDRGTSGNDTKTSSARDISSSSDNASSEICSNNSDRRKEDYKSCVKRCVNIFSRGKKILEWISNAVERARLEQLVETTNMLLELQGCPNRLYLVMPLTRKPPPAVVCALLAQLQDAYCAPISALPSALNVFRSDSFSFGHLMEGDKASFPREVLSQAAGKDKWTSHRPDGEGRCRGRACCRSSDFEFAQQCKETIRNVFEYHRHPVSNTCDTCLILERRLEPPWHFLIEKVHYTTEQGSPNGVSSAVSAMADGCFRGPAASVEKRSRYADATTGDRTNGRRDGEESRHPLQTHDQTEEKTDGGSTTAEDDDDNQQPQRVSVDDSTLNTAALQRDLLLHIYLSVSFRGGDNTLKKAQPPMFFARKRPMSVVACSWVRLPVAEHVTFQPVEPDFLAAVAGNRQSIQQCLEEELRHYSSLTVNTSIPLRVGRTVYHLKVAAVKPEKNGTQQIPSEEAAAGVVTAALDAIPVADGTQHVCVQDTDVSTTLLSGPQAARKAGAHPDVSNQSTI